METQMALEQSGTAPYAPVRAVALVIDQFRDRTVPTPITVTSLQRLGIEPSLTQRTLAALKQLELVDKSGEPTPTLRKIKTASTDDIQATLADWVREMYKPILSYVDPTDDVTRITDQFRHYEPAAQRGRMVTLFLGLCAKAGLIEKVPPLPRVRNQNGTHNPVIQRTPRSPKPKVDLDNSAEIPLTNPPALDGLTEARQRYVDLLLAKAAEQTEPDGDLLDRIERALGIAATERGSTP